MKSIWASIGNLGTFSSLSTGLLDIEHACALSSRPCIAPTFSSLAAPSALFVEGFCAWEKDGAPSSAALTRRAAPPMYAMGGAALFQPRPRGKRPSFTNARTRLGGHTLTLTVARAVMSRHLHRSKFHSHATNSRTPPDRDTQASLLDQGPSDASNRNQVPTSHPASEGAISQADGEP